jgi:hypothetical protein
MPTEDDTDNGPGLPEFIEYTNVFMDDATNDGRNIAVIRDEVFTTANMADYWGVDSATVSGMRQRYRSICKKDLRCLYVVAHEGAYGPNAPWRILGTRHTVGITEPVRRQYRHNQIRHIAWEFYDHAKKEIVSFGNESLAALVMVDSTTTSMAAQAQRLAVRDYARDMLLRFKRDARRETEQILDRLGVPTRARPEYFKYFENGYWPYIEVLVDEQVRELTAMLP